MIAVMQGKQISKQIFDDMIPIQSKTYENIRLCCDCNSKNKKYCNAMILKPFFKTYWCNWKS